MLVLLSPAKSLDYESPLLIKRSTQPRLADHSAELISQLKGLSEKEIGSLMSISEKLAALNHERFQTYETDFTPENSRQAILAFTGDVYQGLTLADWDKDDFSHAQKTVRILSGLYGLLRPLDLMQPYRLEMGTRLKNSRGKNLYEFWDTLITDLINKDLKGSGSDVIVNLASNEYFSSVKTDPLRGKLISPVFKDEKNGVYKIISFHAKKARGMMADFIVRKKIQDPAELKTFKTAGYRYSAKESSADSPVFLRKEK